MMVRHTQTLAPLEADAHLAPYLDAMRSRREYAERLEARLAGPEASLKEFAQGHTYFGLHPTRDGWVFREWAPNAESITLVGDFSDWQALDSFALRRIEESNGQWEIKLPPDTIRHGQHYRLRLRWPGGGGDRLPAWGQRIVQDSHTHVFCAQVWHPDLPYEWKHVAPPADKSGLLVYETHVGMAQEHGGVGTYRQFADGILPRIAAAGYNAIQLMAVMEHPYYGSFGYHVGSFFAATSRFGTPEELKELIDRAHGAGLIVIMDMIHSHAARNENEGISRFDGTLYQYFHDGERGDHVAWDSRCFDYGKPEVLHFLLSNCRYWLAEFRIDGFRFDGVTSMLYKHHGLGTGFAGYDDYFNSSVDHDAVAYLALANKLIHEVNPRAITIAEDVSGMPGIGAPLGQGGIGFDYRLAMGVPDCWFKLARDCPDHEWSMDYLWHELTNRRRDERTISYVECHDQALVGGKTMIFQLADAAMYDSMRVDHDDYAIERAVALHKIIRLATLATASYGYLNFMGNEFGHPEWVDFPREGNDWSHHYARRQWRLRDDPELRYHHLADFDVAMLELVKEHDVMADAIRTLRVDNELKLIVFERAGLFFLFNFHHGTSYADFPLSLLPGVYSRLLDSDEPRFGGRGRIAPQQEFRTIPLVDGSNMDYRVKIYLPSRTAMVLKKEKQDIPIVVRVPAKK